MRISNSIQTFMTLVSVATGSLIAIGCEGVEESYLGMETTASDPDVVSEVKQWSTTGVVSSSTGSTATTSSSDGGSTDTDDTADTSGTGDGCVDGEFKCDDKGWSLECVDGEFKPADICGTNNPCIDGHCVECNCTAGSKTCVGDAFMECDASCRRWKVLAECSPGECNYDTSVAKGGCIAECEFGTSKCEGNLRLWCKGIGWAITTCTFPEVCILNVNGTIGCSNYCDTPGEKVCGPAGAIVHVCQDDNRWTVSLLCEDDMFCSEGECEIPEIKSPLELELPSQVVTDGLNSIKLEAKATGGSGSYWWAWYDGRSGGGRRNQVPYMFVHVGQTITFEVVVRDYVTQEKVSKEIVVRVPCESNEVSCEPLCVDPQSNNKYCGASSDCADVGHECNVPSGEYCKDGECTK